MKSIGKVCDFGPGLPFKKKVQLYSRTSGRFVQIKTTELDARGKNDSQYARLVLESDFFGRIKIRGENTNRYLCLNKKGKLVTRVRKQKFAAMKSCDFEEEYSEGYFQYKSIKYPRWFIGFSRKGKPTSGRKGVTRQRNRHLIRYDLPNKTKRKRRRDAKHRKNKITKLLQKELLRRWSF